MTCVLWVNVVSGVKGSCLTHAVAATGLQNTPRSFFGVLWKLVIFHEFRVRTQSQDLREEGKKITTYLTLCDTTATFIKL